MPTVYERYFNSILENIQKKRIPSQFFDLNLKNND